ncbi:ABC transporter permease subunit [Dechloromonas denitrificans]|uniref:ABC transporter permease n=1 Tax=Dechloromonas denitrificans TaxID=281362 RepID=UPI001CF87809|nr:ABC transporter permease subunit [Dechloromonas denitrificans]UCV10188.1 ABC transporter permease subunit [Dechloromonas denitrificans]
MSQAGRKAIGAWLAATGHYLWSGWGSLASLCIFMAVWTLTAEAFGPLILPTPLEALSTLGGLLNDGRAWTEIGITARRALAGFGLSVVVGSLLGLAAGVSMTASMMSRPIITVLVGMPPIAWLILALLWFGAGDGTPIFTVFIACFPIIFVGAMQGTRTLDGQLKELARMFGLSTWMKLTDIYLPHVVSYLFPAWIAALGMSWKIVVMAELLSTEDGIGAALAVSRSHLDTAASMAWIVALVGTLLAIEYLLLEPVKRKVESWRELASSSN